MIKEFIRQTADLLSGRTKSDFHFLSHQSEYSLYSMGRFSYGVAGSPLVLSDAVGTGSLKVGKFCSIAAGVTIMLSGEHRPDWVTTYPFTIIFKNLSNYAYSAKTKGDVIIGNDVWIGMDVLILSGVTIGDGAVVGAGSVVTKNVEPYAIVAGNPARFIRKRFDQDVIDELLEIKWWDWDVNRISDNMSLLMSNDIRVFVEKNGSLKNRVKTE
jgi:acetyltransferase-like isoleucine patch superfamily enzyme